MKHFFKITQDHWKPRNKLQGEIKNLLQGYDQTLMDATELEEFLRLINKQILDLCNQHPRTKPCSLQDKSGIIYGLYDLGYYIPSLVHFSIYTCRTWDPQGKMMGGTNG